MMTKFLTAAKMSCARTDTTDLNDITQVDTKVS